MAAMAAAAAAAAEEEYEAVLCVKPVVHVYRVPPRTSNRGYRWGLPLSRRPWPAVGRLLPPAAVTGRLPAPRPWGVWPFWWGAVGGCLLPWRVQAPRKVFGACPLLRGSKACPSRGVCAPHASPTPSAGGSPSPWAVSGLPSVLSRD